MTSVSLQNVSVEFPIYNMSSRSIKNTVLRMGTGGRIATDSKNRVIVQALRNLNLELTEGDRVGIIGHNGAGKSTLLRTVAGIYEPVQGRVRCVGHVTPMFDASLGMDMESTGYENLYLRGIFLNIDPKVIKEKTEEIVEFTELEKFMSMPLRTYSTGMVMRLALAVSTCINPEILLLDEWLSAGDVHFLQKAEDRMQEFVARSGILLLTSHSVETIGRFCNKTILMEQGEIKLFGSTDEVMKEYLKPL